MHWGIIQWMNILTRRNYDSRDERWGLLIGHLCCSDPNSTLEERIERMADVVLSNT